MRLFIAVSIPQHVKEYIAKIQENIDNTSNKIRFVGTDQIHLTLKFLGELQPNVGEEIKGSLKRVVFKPFSVILSSFGVFPSESSISVIWIGLKPEEPILELQKNIDENLKKLFKKEKNFKSHITIARVKFVDNKEKFIDKLKNIKIKNKKIDVKNFKLMKSTLTPQGPIYEDIETFQ
jgi:RNA 2',3'-cyclic 3'-phosphodiesterase